MEAGQRWWLNSPAPANKSEVIVGIPKANSCMFEGFLELRNSTRIFCNVISLVRSFCWSYYHIDVQNEGERLWTLGMKSHLFTWREKKPHLFVMYETTVICCDMALYPRTLLATCFKPSKAETVRHQPALVPSTVSFFGFKKMKVTQIYGDI